MKLQLVPASQGALWARQGLATFVKRPWAFLGLFGALLMAMVVARLLPWIGPLLFLSMLPIATLGFMLATQQALSGRSPSFRVFVLPLRGNRPRARALYQMGLLYAVLMLAISAVRLWIDGGRTEAFQAAMASGHATSEGLVELLADGRLQLSMLWFAGATALLSLPFWHAPGLVYWGEQPMAKSLFFSTMACWRNKGAFMVYGLTGMAAITSYALVCALVFTLVGQPDWAPVAMMFGVLMFSTAFYASLFFTFADCFEMPAETAAEGTPTP